jgi:hypothetical protein
MENLRGLITCGTLASVFGCTALVAASIYFAREQSIVHITPEWQTINTLDCGPADYVTNVQGLNEKVPWVSVRPGGLPQDKIDDVGFGKIGTIGMEGAIPIDSDIEVGVWQEGRIGFPPGFSRNLYPNDLHKAISLGGVIYDLGDVSVCEQKDGTIALRFGPEGQP